MIRDRGYESALEHQIGIITEAFHTAEARLADAQIQIKNNEIIRQTWIRSYDDCHTRENILIDKLQAAEDMILILKARLYDVLEGDAK